MTDTDRITRLEAKLEALQATGLGSELRELTRNVSSLTGDFRALATSVDDQRRRLDVLEKQSTRLLVVVAVLAAAGSAGGQLVLKLLGA